LGKSKEETGKGVTGDRDDEFGLMIPLESTNNNNVENISECMPPNGSRIRVE